MRNRDWVDRVALKRCLKEDRYMRQGKLIIGEQTSKACLAKVRKIDRRQLRLAMGWLIGTNYQYYHLSKFVLAIW